MKRLCSKRSQTEQCSKLPRLATEIRSGYSKQAKTHECNELTMSDYVAHRLSVSYGQTVANHYHTI